MTAAEATPSGAPPSSGGPLVVLDHVNKWFGDLHVLQDINALIVQAVRRLAGALTRRGNAGRNRSVSLPLRLGFDEVFTPASTKPSPWPHCALNVAAGRLKIGAFRDESNARPQRPRWSR